MSARINAKWLTPMPTWYEDFADREYEPVIASKYGEPRLCAMCGEPFGLRSKFATTREICYRDECELQRKRRNRTASARRIRMQRQAQK